MAVLAELNVATQKIVFSTTWAHRDLAKAIPGSRWDNKKSEWSIPVSWAACLAMRATFKTQLELGPELSAWAINELETRITPCNDLRELTEFADGDGDLYGWQRSGAEFIRIGKQVLIGDDPGAGKTATVVRGLMRMYVVDGTNPFPCLVVAPNSVKRSWLREFDMWWPGIQCEVLHGSVANRRKQLKKESHVFITNWESLKSLSRLAPYGSIALKRCTAHGGEDPKVSEARCQVHEREFNKIEWSSVIADEVHRARFPQSQQTRALWAATGDAPIRIGLSGTPTGGDPSDLWALMHWLNPLEWPSRVKWIDRFMNVMYNGWGGSEIVGIKPEMRDEFYGSISPRFRRMPEDLILKFLPPIVNEQRDVELSPKQAKAYMSLAKDMIAALDGSLTMLKALDPLSKTMRLLQLASSYGEVEETIIVDPDTGMVKTRQKLILQDPSSKLDAFMDDIDGFGTDQVAVAAVSRQLIELLSSRLTKAKIPHGLITGKQNEFERQDAIDNFQAGRIQFILLTSAAGGTGVTLTAAKYLARLQRPHSLIEDKQLLRRVRRIGSERHDVIFVRDYLGVGTLDYAVVDALDHKGVSFSDIVLDTQLLRRALEDSGEL